MTHVFTFWLDRLLSETNGAVRLPRPADRKSMKIDVEHLPDYQWRELGFQQPRRFEGGE
jgi:hypothetical protein